MKESISYWKLARGAHDKGSQRDKMAKAKKFKTHYGLQLINHDYCVNAERPNCLFLSFLFFSFLFHKIVSRI